jgi:hypothetical protein
MLTDEQVARLCEPLVSDCGAYHWVYSDRRDYVSLETANARLAELAAHIRELRARYREVDKDHAAICARLQDCVRKYDIGLPGGRLDVDVVAHIAGEPARTAAAVAAELAAAKRTAIFSRWNGLLAKLAKGPGADDIERAQALSDPVKTPVKP